jgi:cytochrome bd-type quinol oxidase subunit 2
MEFQFGTNWAKFAHYSGGVIATALAMEGVFAFFLESSFLGLFLFGEKRIGQKWHLFGAFMVFLGSWLSGYFIIVTDAWIIPAVVAASLGLMPYFRAKRRDKAAFISSTAYIVAMLGGAAFALHPYLLPASENPDYSLTIYNAKTGAYSLRVGLVWWIVSMMLALGYFIFLYRFFGGKVELEEPEG